MCCAVAAKSSYRHASTIPHSLRQMGLSYRGFGKLWSAFGSFQPFITNDTVEPPTETLISRGNSTRLSVNYVKLKRASLSGRSEEHTSELQSLMRISYAVFCLNKKKKTTKALLQT